MEPLGRQAAFFGAVCALAQRLRSVFVPYYRYVIDGALAHLGSGAAAEAQPKKKRKKSGLAAGDEAAARSPQSSGLQWLVRHRVSRQNVPASHASQDTAVMPHAACHGSVHHCLYHMQSLPRRAEMIQGLGVGSTEACDRAVFAGPEGTAGMLPS